MKGGRRLHLPATGEGSELGASLCGRAAVVLVGPSHADCVTCRRLAAAAAAAGPRHVTWMEAVRDLAHLLARPNLAPYPELTPARYRSMTCRLAVSEGSSRASACACDFCAVDRQNRSAKANREAEEQLRPHRAYRHPLGSMRAALSALVQWQRDPIPLRSSTGSAMARLLEAAAIGATIQTTRRHDRDDLSTRRAQLATDIEHAVVRAYARAEDCRGLPRAMCIELLLDSVEERRTVEEWAELLGVHERIVVSVIRHGRRAVEVELAALELIPAPSAKKKLDGAIEARRRQLTEAERG